MGRERSGRGRASVLAALAGAACGGGRIEVPRPSGLVPGSLSEAQAWVASTVPGENREIRFRWQFRDDRGAAAGRGRIRLAPPDSARLDVAGPLGSGRAAAFVWGDTAVWAQPEEDVKRMVPDYPLFWAMLGIARPPSGAVVRRYADQRLTVWQFGRHTDTVDYVRVAGPPVRLIVEVRTGGSQLAAVETHVDESGQPLTSRLIVPGVPARLDITIYSNLKARPFAPDTWTPPQL